MTTNQPKPLSRHFFGTITTSNIAKLVDLKQLILFVDELLHQNSVEIIGKIEHSFGHDTGYSLVIALAESHLSIHSWPENHTVQLDVFLCNYMNDNRKISKDIFDQLCAYFEPSDQTVSYVDRS